MTFSKSDLERVALPALNDIHDEEVEMVGRIVDLCAAGEEAALGDAISELHEHFKAHFDLEEANMLRTDFEDYDEHKGEHEAFLLRYEAVMEEGSLEEVKEFFGSQLPEWFVDHVANLDVVTAEHVAGWS